uniref:Transposon Ty3-I Gag-Pol polyprotein n=1 Tax=Cajanus cajan TaxID=3821 RepID=A0A151RZ57_CAJCA|nr:Transposon Ty3-I Gag-Pol polyprotein [Cajanus cajan]
MSQVIQTHEQQTYLSKLLGYDYSIHYKSGASNVVADALSRIPILTQSTFYTLSIPNFTFLEELHKSLKDNSEFRLLLSQIRDDPNSHADFRIHRDLIFFKGKIWINADNPLRTTLLQEFHQTPLGGHLGVAKTLHRLQANFFSTHMRKDVQTFVAQCSTCQLMKYETKRPAGLLQPLPIPSTIWEDLSLDFITGLPTSQGHSTILVVVDRFSKGVHLGVLPSHYSAYKVAMLFVDMVCKLHGFPRSLVSDRDPIFISHFWRELFKLSGTKLRMSTAYHPESNGQTEVFNRVLEQYLRSFVHEKPSQWSKFISLAEWSYNTSVHSGTGLTPYEITYGKPPPTIPHYILGSSNIEAVDSVLTTREALYELLQKRLSKAQAAMKHSADSKRRDVYYKVGDWVYVKLRPYRQLSVSGSYHKLSKRFYGPF